MSKPTSLDLARTWLKRAEESSYTEQEVERLRHAIGSILTHLESHPQPQVAPESSSSETSSAPMTGPATRLSQWSDASHASKPEPSVLMGLITDFFRSTSYTEPELEVQWNGSSTLRLTLRWPTQSGESKAGDRGPASPEVVE